MKSLRYVFFLIVAYGWTLPAQAQKPDLVLEGDVTVIHRHS
jgi:hypothetical protein